MAGAGAAGEAETAVTAGPLAAVAAPDRATVAGAAGLRERKKRLMRQRLSDTATAMFLERGFDAVRVAEVADACGVSEKTVFNYFPVKEALIMDRLEGTLAALRDELAERSVAPVDAVVAVLGRELGGITGWEPGGAEATGAENSQDVAGRADAGTDYTVRHQAIRRFGDLIRATPALWAYQADMMERSVAVATGILATRAGLAADDPEPQIAARALMGLWRVQADSLRKHLDAAASPGQLHELVMADVRRAARIVRGGVMGPEMHYDS